MAQPRNAVLDNKAPYVGQMPGLRLKPGRTAAGQPRFARPLAKGQRQRVDPISGKKVFAKEYVSGFKMARVAGFHRGENASRVSGMRARLAGIDAGTITPRAGERSFLRGAMRGAIAGSGGG